MPRRGALGLALLLGLGTLGLGTLGQPAAARETKAATVRELHVVTSGGFTAAFQALAAKYERDTGVHIVTEHGPSMGDTPQAIPNRLARHEDADVVILARSGLDKLAQAGTVTSGTVTDLGLSRIAMAVKAGAPAPDIATPDALRATLVHARSVAWSDSASGVYIQSTLLDRLGVADQVRPKGRMIPATPVGRIVAEGQAEIGFQQLSELKPVKGIHIVGLIPESLQKVTPFSAGVVAYSPHQAEARALIAYLASPKAYPIIRESGLEPASQKAKP
ncbi:MULTISPECIES: substrate-binding domain-containing protein [unclassified Sphingomonas]|uniref:substrate-binding domain-containing protein n=1 Tax=unclassified Sphingomonas TaxID=196159 RepID=UPI00285F0AA7|nr:MULTISPECIES: substrate-binding domain-containing protein [unclassified Sphingomonas]MDR6113292.1 molybdate transport system substrate-binding protein [Sphingomonas sp. SORGH_AS_0789]MDR6149347.1 molybdate transport system substrate-binding protein [Sphingomonas sp. SORGH_AS_0742]